MQKVLRIILFKMKYKIYTDGACSGNPGPGGWAAIILYNNEIKEMFSGSEKNTTNNQMELLAPIKAIQKFKKKIRNFNFYRLYLCKRWNYNLGWEVGKKWMENYIKKTCKK